MPAARPHRILLFPYWNPAEYGSRKPLYKVIFLQEKEPQLKKFSRGSSVSLPADPQIRARLLSMYSQPVTVNALNSVVSITVLEVRTPSCPIFLAMT